MIAEWDVSVSLRLSLPLSLSVSSLCLPPYLSLSVSLCLLSLPLSVSVSLCLSLSPLSVSLCLLSLSPLSVSLCLCLLSLSLFFLLIPFISSFPSLLISMWVLISRPRWRFFPCLLLVEPLAERLPSLRCPPASRSFCCLWSLHSNY